MVKDNQLKKDLNSLYGYKGGYTYKNPIYVDTDSVRMMDDVSEVELLNSQWQFIKEALGYYWSKRPEHSEFCNIIIGLITAQQTYAEGENHD